MHAQRMPPHITTPFDDSAAMRLRRMGLLTPDGTPDEHIIRPLAYASAGLYYDQLCDSVESHESAAGVCQHIISEETENRPRQALLALSMSYDAILRLRAEGHRVLCADVLPCDQTWIPLVFRI